MSREYIITLTDSPAPEDLKVVREGLENYNTSMGVELDWVSLALFIRDPEGNVVGGLTGGTYWGWLYVGFFWLVEDVRGQGMGSQLLDQAEKEARRRGCRNSFLDTTSFQSLSFYQKHGYILYGQLDNFPPGHSRYFLKKELA
jgi:GNAT superfamily N-acetyltransferase